MQSVRLVAARLGFSLRFLPATRTPRQYNSSRSFAALPVRPRPRHSPRIMSSNVSAPREELEAAVAQQGSIVRELKKAKASVDDINAAVAELVARKKALADFAAQEVATGPTFDKFGFEELMKRRFFFAPAFEIYGGVGGLYDYGPTGCAIMNNICSEWRRHFIISENMLEVDCPAMTPDFVLQASGHVERFADIMVRDVVTGDCHRADHLLEDVMHAKMIDPATSPELRAECEKIKILADAYSKEELWELYKRFGIKSPTTGNDLTEPVDFNMMFGTQIGPTGKFQGFLRPETAQGIFLAFKRLYEFNNFRLPFAGAQIGVAYRNEIAPKSGLLRVREFRMAEIEHFVDPDDKSHPKFQKVAGLVLPLYTAEAQKNAAAIQRMTLGEAVANKVIANETLGFFIGRIYEFMRLIGVNTERLRFRQHLPTEMAHYACDCWDCELETSFGWIECVGCADRSCYDLQQHAKASKVPLVASAMLENPVVRDVVAVMPNKGIMGKQFKKEAKLVFQHFENMSNEAAEAFEAQLKAGPVAIVEEGQSFTIEPEWVQIVRKQVKEHDRKFVPSVIEPSFGLGRIIYSLLEHSFDCREGDSQRVWLNLSPRIAPVKCSVLPLSKDDIFVPVLDELEDRLTREGVSVRRDDSGASIGKRYARTDEIGIPFGVTVDFDTSKDRTVTLRDRNTMGQVRLPIDEVANTISQLSRGLCTWDDIKQRFPVVENAATDE